MKYKHNPDALCNRHTNRQLTHCAANTKNMHIGVFFIHLLDRFMRVLVSHGSKTSSLMLYSGALSVCCGTWELGPWRWGWGRAPVWFWEDVLAGTVLLVTGAPLCDKDHC